MIVGTKGQIGHKGTEAIFKERDAKIAESAESEKEGKDGKEVAEKRGVGRPPKNGETSNKVDE